MSTSRKPHVKIFFSSSDNHPKSSNFCQKRPKWCPKNALYLENQKSYQKSDLIFRIYDKFPFLYIPSDFNLLVIFWVKIWHKLGQFSCLFGMVLSFGVFFWPITWSEVRQNEYKADSNHGWHDLTLSHFSDACRCLRSYQPKSSCQPKLTLKDDTENIRRMKIFWKSIKHVSCSMGVHISSCFFPEFFMIFLHKK